MVVSAFCSCSRMLCIIVGLLCHCNCFPQVKYGFDWLLFFVGALQLGWFHHWCICDLSHVGWCIICHLFILLWLIRFASINALFSCCFVRGVVIVSFLLSGWYLQPLGTCDVVALGQLGVGLFLFVFWPFQLLLFCYLLWCPCRWASWVWSMSQWMGSL